VKSYMFSTKRYKQNDHIGRMIISRLGGRGGWGVGELVTGPYRLTHVRVSVVCGRRKKVSHVTVSEDITCNM
jgi:hypothetical protein